MRSSSSSRRARALASLLILVSPVYALNVSTSLADQYPQVAHAGQPYSWTFSPSTFSGDDAAPSYAAKGLPSWASFDADSHTVSGTPPANEQDTTKVTITAASGSSSASSPFDLVVVEDPQPTLKKSLVDQLPTASSLGRSQILPGSKLHIPWGWSFSVGWQGDTFYLESGNEIFTHATINGDQPLPRWLKYSSQTYAMWGIAPNVPGPEGTEFVFSLTGSNVEGKFGGTTTNVSIVLGTGSLSTTGSLPALNATAGQEVSYAIPISAFSVDGAAASAQAVNITADTSALSWLSYDEASRTLKGTPPAQQEGQTASLPITVTNSLGKSLNASLAVNLFPPAFSADVLPNVMVTAGQQFNVSLADFVRNSTQHNISITLDPQSASEWVKFDATNLVLSGMPPKMGANDKVKVRLQSAAPSSQQQLQRRADTSSSPSNQASFYIAPQGSKPGPAGSTSTGSGSGNHGGSGGSGLSQRTKIGLAAGLGTVGAIIILVLLMMFARRCCAVEDHDSHGNVIVPGKSPAFSERTLTNDVSPNPAMWGQEAEKAEKKAVSPAFVGSSPAELKGILVGGRHYGGQQGNEVSEDAAPRQHGFMSALVAGARRFGSSRSISQQAEQQQPPMQQQQRGRSDSQGLGLSGLDLDTPDSDDPYRGANAVPSRSHLSMRSKESWEEDLFYSSTEAADRGMIAGGGMGSALTPVIEVDEVPTRRGGSESSVGGSSHLRVSSRSNPMRHRSGHNKASPSFTTSDTFETPTVDELPQQGASYDDELPVTESSGPYTIGTAQRVDVRSLTRQGSVQSHRPDLRKGHHHSRSTHLDAIGAFEDADDEEGQIVAGAGRDGRTSTASNVDALTASHLEGLQYIQYPSGVGATSPRPPSFFGGSSIASNVRPEDTMRAVVTPPPRTPGSPRRPSSLRGGIVEHLEANVSMGERIRIKLTPPGGAAMMGGAPGSPGKRSNRRGKYVPVLDDASMQAHGTWPIWLAEWLHWDPTMFELSGEVPVDFELPELHIALVHRRTGADLAAGSSSGSGANASAPSPRPAHHRQGSQDSAMTVVEDEVVIRLTLFIDWPVDPTGSGNHIALRREGAGGAGTAF